MPRSFGLVGRYVFYIVKLHCTRFTGLKCVYKRYNLNDNPHNPVHLLIFKVNFAITTQTSSALVYPFCNMIVVRDDDSFKSVQFSMQVNRLSGCKNLEIQPTKKGHIDTEIVFCSFWIPMIFQFHIAFLFISAAVLCSVLVLNRFETKQKTCCTKALFGL